ncbi:GNAT family N-acetyltransferase [Pseudidiomarina sp. GXY010]|uniref:GNAT family N-acetyltransferase n=1 Tax=Pseudidiomarina fusca TaxID=2965078 RepID=A0ABU3KTC7_9GAMM|nr:N-acetyltransferase [Pseudidiomarina sp. GXY010]MDT7524733.1 GNAT family N-acetyltransferase [Pseudidiomarina sp. GXY010]
MAALNVRIATAADVLQLAALEYDQYGAEAYPAPLFYQALAQWPHLQWLAEGTGLSTRTEQLAGYIMAAPDQQPECCWIMSVLVNSAWRGQGVGKQLLQAWLEHLPPGYREVKLTVAPNNTAAIGLYQQLGFTEQAYLADFLGPGEDRLLLSCDLHP